MMQTAHDWRDERQSLTAKERDVLASLGRAPIRYNVGRNMPNEYRTVIAKGLGFRSFNLITITPKGEETLERVG